MARLAQLQPPGLEQVEGQGWEQLEAEAEAEATLQEQAGPQQAELELQELELQELLPLGQAERSPPQAQRRHRPLRQESRQRRRCHLRALESR